MKKIQINCCKTSQILEHNLRFWDVFLGLRVQKINIKTIPPKVVAAVFGNLFGKKLGMFWESRHVNEKEEL